MILKDVIKQKTATITAWMDFQGIEMLLECTDREELKKMLKASEVSHYDRHQKVTKNDDELFAVQLSKKILDWDLTMGKLAQVYPLSMAGVDPAEKIPFAPEEAEILVLKVVGLAAWLQNVLSDVAAFRAAEAEAERKNSTAGGASSCASGATNATSAKKPSPTA